MARTAHVKMDWPRLPQSFEAVDAKADLRGVHWAVGYRSNGRQQTETKLKYAVPNSDGPPTIDMNFVRDLKTSHIDLAYGVDKSCKKWMTVQTDDMSRNASDKYGCEKPVGCGHLGKELRRTNIALSCGHLPPVQSEQKSRFSTPLAFDQAQNLSRTLGKDLRASHIDLANGWEKTARPWQGMMTAEMGQHAREKYQCKKPQAMEELSRELRKSNINLGGPTRR